LIETNALPLSQATTFVHDNAGTWMHDTLAKLLVQDSGTCNLDRELGLCAVGITLPVCYFLLGCFSTV